MFGLKSHREFSDGSSFNLQKNCFTQIKLFTSHILKRFWKNNKENFIQGITSGLKNVTVIYTQNHRSFLHLKREL